MKEEGEGCFTVSEIVTQLQYRGESRNVLNRAPAMDTRQQKLQICMWKPGKPTKVYEPSPVGPPAGCERRVGLGSNNEQVKDGQAKMGLTAGGISVEVALEVALPLGSAR